MKFDFIKGVSLGNFGNDLFVIRRFRKDDRFSLQKSISDRSIYRYTLRIPFPYTLNHAEIWIRKCRSSYSEKCPSDLGFAVVASGWVVGGIGLAYIEGHKAELGYWLAKNHRGRGVMTRAVRIICSFGFQKLKLRRIYATVFSRNKASARVLEKAGFRFEGVLRKENMKKGRLIAALLFAKVI